MAKEVTIIEYNDSYKEKWDKFVLSESVNGTFLQTRNFLDYHPKGRFKDNSLIFLNKTTIIAVLPAHISKDGEKKVFNSHQGSTFGGIVVGKKYCRIGYMDLIFEQFEKYMQDKLFNKVILKQTGKIYQKNASELIDYYLFLNGYIDSCEIGYYINYQNYGEEVINNFSASRRRDYRYSLKNKFQFKELEKEKEIEEFFKVLCDNYNKFGKNPVHSLDEILDFRFVRLRDNVRFYGVSYCDELIAGGMVFLFDRNVFHTQYLAVKQEKKDKFVNEFLYTNLIEIAKKEGFANLSFGTSTLDGGRVLNKSLAQFKEGFGTQEYVNRTYLKILNDL